MTDDFESITSSSVAQALASDYFSIYYVNTENDHFIEYSSSPQYQELKIEKAGEDFFHLSRKNIERVIHPDDREMFLEAFTKEKILVALFTRPTFTLTYRLMFGETPTYVHLKATRMKNREDSHIVIGVSNIDEQMKAKEAFERAHNASVTFSRIAQALAEDYFSIYYVDMNDDSFVEYSSDSFYNELGIEKSGEDFFNLSRKNILRVMHPDDQGAFLATFTKENIISVLDQHKTFTLTYRLLFGSASNWVSMKATRMKDTDGNHIIIGVNNIDAQMKLQEEYKKSTEDRITYGRIAQALAGDYFSIYVVNPDTDHFLEYSASDAYNELGIEKGGDDFFTLSRKNIERIIYPEDKDMFISVFTKENLMREMELHGIFTIKYRLMFGETPTYVSMKATLMDDEHGRHVIIGVNNIDIQMRREQDYAQSLNAAREKANRDALTGVKSKHAYVEKEEQLNQAIAAGQCEGFAVAVFDVNGLKTVNDTQGHAAGDELIRHACSIICNNFKHSPVFRTGGDEFVIIAQGQDYQNLEQLTAGLRQQNEKNLTSGGVVIACGAARFENDAQVLSVFERADAAMYENKKALKQR